jgi:TorA maturation chaperone TorD
MDPRVAYRIFAAAFAYPQKDVLQGLGQIPGFKVDPDTDLDELRREYTRLFTPTVAGGLPPYETEYGKAEIFRKTQILADIAGFYRAFGLDIAESAHERVDFVSVELEFMHWLSLKEQRALEKGERENAALCHDAQAKFLCDHLGRWTGHFGATVANEARLAFYRNLGGQLTKFIAAECRRLGVSPETVREYAPEPDASTSFECGDDGETVQAQPFKV